MLPLSTCTDREGIINFHTPTRKIGGHAYLTEVQIYDWFHQISRKTLHWIYPIIKIVLTTLSVVCIMCGKAAGRKFESDR
jgi:hypothetical protein